MADAKAAAKKQDAKKSGNKPANKKKPNVFQRLWKYLIACKGELKKITWPTKKITWPTPRQTTKNFRIVLVVIIIMGLFIFALDRGLFALLGLVMGMSQT